MQEVDDEVRLDQLQCETFCDWMQEGRTSCEIAQAMWHRWIGWLSASVHDTLYDFWKQLLDAYSCAFEPAQRVPVRLRGEISASWLATWILQNCTLTFRVEGDDDRSKVLFCLTH